MRGPWKRWLLVALGAALAAAIAPPATVGGPISPPGAGGRATDREPAGAPSPLPDHPRMLTGGVPTFRAPRPARHRIPLAGGSVLYVVEDHSLPLVDVVAAARAGRYLEPVAKAGLAGLTGALMRSGGAGELDADALDRALDQLGAEIRTGIGDRRAGASLSATTWTLDRALPLFFDILARPRFQPDRLETLRGNLREALTRRNADPLEVLEREWGWLLFGHDHFLTRAPTASSAAELQREDLLALHRRAFQPGHLIFAVSGDVDPKVIRERIEEALADWPQPGPAPAPWPPPAPPLNPMPGLFHAEADVPQAKVLIGHRVHRPADRSPRERAGLEIMNEVLGGSGAISRIAGRLRTVDGLAYRASSHYDLGLPWPTDFRVFFETKNRSVARAVAAAREEIERIRSQLVHPQELAVAKQALLASIRSSFDSAEKLAGYLAEDELLGRPHESWQERYEAIQAVTAGELREAAESALHPSELVYLVVGRGSEIGLTRSTNPFDPSELERQTGHRVRRLPRRDPLTLEPITPASKTVGE